MREMYICHRVLISLVFFSHSLEVLIFFFLLSIYRFLLWFSFLWMQTNLNQTKASGFSVIYIRGPLVAIMKLLRDTYYLLFFFLILHCYFFFLVFCLASMIHLLNFQIHCHVWNTSTWNYIIWELTLATTLFWKSFLRFA